MKEIENEYNCTVYAITHEHTAFGECYSFLIISDYPEEWDYAVEICGNNEFNAFAYVWNKSDDDCSEFGTVGMRKLFPLAVGLFGWINLIPIIMKSTAKNTINFQFIENLHFNKKRRFNYGKHNQKTV